MEDEQVEDSINGLMVSSENIENVATASNTKKKKRSDVWPHFTTLLILEEGVQVEYAQCNYCPK